MALQQTLQNLCSNSGWCYAVFWKVKRRSRMVLTWEDVYCELQSSDAGGSMGCPESGGNPLCQGATRRDASYCQHQIGLAVAKMSYCVYFMGEGIIGRVAFTGKHQWVFADGEQISFGGAFGSACSNQAVLEKYPSSWEAQFTAGIKTIAIIAVQQGVVQLGSTQMKAESLEWVDNVKSAFGALQSSQGAGMASDGQVGVAPSCFSKGPGKVNANKPPSRVTIDCSDIGFQSLTYGTDGAAFMSTKSNLQGLPSVIEPQSSLHCVANKREIGKAFKLEMGSSVIRSLVQTAETLATASDSVQVSNSQVYLGHEDEKQDFHQEQTRKIHSRQGTNRLHAVSASGRVPGSCMDAVLSTSLREQSSESGVFSQGRASDSGSRYSLISSGEQGLQQVKDTGLFGFHPTVSMTMSETGRLASNLGSAAAVSQGSFVGKGGESREFLVDSVVGIPSYKSCIDEISQKPCSAGPLSVSEGAADKSTIPERWDVFENYLTSVNQGQSSHVDCSFGFGDELSQALGPCFYRNHSKGGTSSHAEHAAVVADKHTPGRKGPLSDMSAESAPALDSSLIKSDPRFSEIKAGSLLDAVVASASSSRFSISTAADDSFSCRTLSAKDDESSATKIPKITSVKPIGSHSSQNCMSQSILQGVLADCEAAVSNNDFDKVLNDPLSFNISATCPHLKAVPNSWAEDIQSMRSDGTQNSQPKKSEDPAHKSTRKRARPGESTRPRPKDRQQIQDRVRELREIVPNGSKCSIDALLEKTIKHMLFLQNVTLHADNLKKNGELKEDVESGASWALELGGQDTGQPPILVKNLNQPRQFLVEMFCEEKGHFLEIANIIRGLGLTILKGVMESRSDRIWARFVVEASKDIKRVDIMMPLMHLLHVNNNSSSSTTIGSQTAPLRSHIHAECSSSSQSPSLGGFTQPSSLHV